MSEKAERVFNLVAYLLDTRRPVAASEIRDKIPGYDGQTDAAFHRMFERDKAEIRELGYTLEQGESIDGEVGYRIAKDDILLEDPGFTPDEMAALSFAAQAWSRRADGALALAKLSVGASVSEPGASGWRPPQVDIDDRVVRLLDAVTRRKRVTFVYRTGGGGEPHERTVDAYSLKHHRTWYLTGFDAERGAVRHFRLSRIEGNVAVAAGEEPDFPPPPAVRDVPRGPWEGENLVAARVTFAPEVAFWAERRTGARPLATEHDGWVEVEMPVAEPEQFAAWIAGFGDRAVVLAPAEIRDAVIAHLRAVEGV